MSKDEIFEARAFIYLKRLRVMAYDYKITLSLSNSGGFLMFPFGHVSFFDDRYQIFNGATTRSTKSTKEAAKIIRKIYEKNNAI